MSVLATTASLLPHLLAGGVPDPGSWHDAARVRCVHHGDGVGKVGGPRHRGGRADHARRLAHGPPPAEARAERSVGGSADY